MLVISKPVKPAPITTKRSLLFLTANIEVVLIKTTKLFYCWTESFFLKSFKLKLHFLRFTLQSNQKSIIKIFRNYAAQASVFILKKILYFYYRYQLNNLNIANVYLVRTNLN
jgi:hypothetical protein